MQEEGPRLATPTDAPVEVPRRDTGEGAWDPDLPDLRDAGFPVGRAWAPGDAWDWESGERFRSLRVVDLLQRQGKSYLQVVQAEGPLGPGEVRKVSWWIEADGYAKVNQTDLGNARNATFSPPAPGLRTYRNMTLTYVESGAPRDAIVDVEVWYGGPSRAQSVWGEVDAGRVEEWAIRRGHEPARTHTVRHVSRDWGNDVTFTVNDETFRLVAIRFGAVDRGVLRDV